MRLSIVTDTFPPDVNGVANTLRRLRGLLQTRGHEVDLVLPGDLRVGAHKAGLISEEESSARLRLAALPVPGYKGLRFGLFSRAPLRKHWTKYRPDIIYVATESPLGFSAVEAAEDLGIAVVSGYHTNFDTYMQDYKVPMLKSIAGGYLKNLHNRTAATFAPAPDVIDRLQETGFKEIRLLGRGVDTVLFDPDKRCPELRREWGAADDNTTVGLYVGRVAPEKNVPLALESAAALRASEIASGRDSRMVVVGDGPKREELAKAHPGVIFAGTLTGVDLARAFASADLFLFPSTSETFGNVILEAMASGLVTVSFDYAATSLHVRDGQNGFAVSPVGDAGAFLTACGRAADREKWPEIRAEARRTSLAISWDAVADQFESDLLELLARHGGKS
ncbi:MAG: glycosyltransferase family 4 protein [Verrucomicrobiales bacterium]